MKDSDPSFPLSGNVFLCTLNISEIEEYTDSTSEQSLDTLLSTLTEKIQIVCERKSWLLTALDLSSAYDGLLMIQLSATDFIF